MALKQKKNFALSFSIIISLSSLLLACASMQHPQGGPKDTSPPKVLKETPKGLTKNFKDQKVVIEFDEYFKLQNEYKEVSISPELEKPLLLKRKQKRLEVNFDSKLEENTTYTINFGKAIQDVNEGNILKNYSYVFSTGNTIDSLSISGSVVNSTTREAEKEVLVFVLPLKRDSLFGKKRATIYTLTDSAGNFKIQNLKEDTYKLYALKEPGGGDKIYQQVSDEIGFLKEPIELKKNVSGIKMEIFKEKPEVAKVKDRRIQSDGVVFINFNTQLKDPKINITDPAALDKDKIYEFNAKNDTLKMWLKDMSFDSIKVAVTDKTHKLPPITLTKGKKDTYTRNITAIDNTLSGKIRPKKELKFTFNFPIQNVKKESITLLEDSLKKTDWTITKDSTSSRAYVFSFPWRKKKKYEIKFDEGAVIDIYGDKNKIISKKVELDDEDNYGQITLKIDLADPSKQYIVELLNEQKMVIKSDIVAAKTTLNYLNYPTGKYIIRVIQDDNRNGEWDTGNLKEGKQPEKIWYYDKPFTLRPNWDKEENMTIPKDF